MRGTDIRGTDIYKRVVLVSHELPTFVLVKCSDGFLCRET
jgi:hypothetical protein